MARCKLCDTPLVYDEVREVWIDPTDPTDEGGEHEVETWDDIRANDD
jgi:hypothetical protein